MGLPVVIIRGILESGKTTFIQNSLKNKDFGDLGRVLILSLESGEVEYDQTLLKKCNAQVEYVENKEDFTFSKINDLVRKYKPHVLFIEVNETWEFEELPLPSYFDIQQVMLIIDGTTFSTYFSNMRQRFFNMITGSEIVLINRCKPVVETSQFKRSVKMINNNVAVLALDENDKEIKLESDLPYSLKGEIIKINLDDFGAFYIDTFENKDRYVGKVVEFECMAVFDKKLPPKSFIAGRLAMTCCVDDIQLIGHLCAYKQELNIKDRSWVKLKAHVHYLKFKGAKGEQIVFDALEITPIENIDDEKALLKLT